MANVKIWSWNINVSAILCTQENFVNNVSLSERCQEIRSALFLSEFERKILLDYTQNSTWQETWLLRFELNKFIRPWSLWSLHLYRPKDKRCSYGYFHSNNTSVYFIISISSFKWNKHRQLIHISSIISERKTHTQQGSLSIQLRGKRMFISK